MARQPDKGSPAATPAPPRSVRRQRVEYREAGAAMRDVLYRAAQAKPPLRPREWAVLGAVLQVTGTYSRLEEKITHLQLAVLAGDVQPDADGYLPPLTESQRRAVRDDIKSLNERGLITYTPGRGRGAGGHGIPSRVGIPAPSSGGQATPLTAGTKGGDATPLTATLKGGQGTPGKGGQATPVPEKTSEKKPPAGARDATPPSDAADVQEEEAAAREPQSATERSQVDDVLTAYHRHLRIQLGPDGIAGWKRQYLRDPRKPRRLVAELTAAGRTTAEVGRDAARLMPATTARSPGGVFVHRLEALLEEPYAPDPSHAEPSGEVTALSDPTTEEGPMPRDRYGDEIEPEDEPMTRAEQAAAIDALPAEERAELLAEARASNPLLGDRQEGAAVRGAILGAWRRRQGIDDSERATA